MNIMRSDDGVTYRTENETYSAGLHREEEA
jgi:hypothetical protein